MTSHEDQKQKHPATTPTPEEASTQLKTQFSNLFGFFSKVSNDVSTSSAHLAKEVPKMDFVELIKKAKLSKSLQKSPENKDTTPRKTPTENHDDKHDKPAHVEKSHENKDTTPRKTPTENHEKYDQPAHVEKSHPENKDTTPRKTPVEHAQKPAKAVEKSHETGTSAQNIAEEKEKPASKPQSKKGDKSQRGPVLKEGTMHIEPPKKEAQKSAPPAPSYKNLGELFDSISKFFSKTTESIETGTANAYAKMQVGFDLNNRIKNGLRVPDKKAIAAAQAAAEEKERAHAAAVAESRKNALNSAGKKRLEEAKKMKENFEKQLKNLDQEIALLEHDGGSEELGKKEKKAFRINSQKSGRESTEKTNLNTSQPNLPKPQKKMLVPIEGQGEGKNSGKKWQEGDKEPKTLKTVASQPLYMRMEKEFMQNVVFPELEARKEKLKLKRDLYKPMDDKELREHALKYEERRKIMAPSLEREELKQVPLNFAKSHTYKKILELDKEDKIKAEQKANEKKAMKDKQQQYAKLVKEMFFPKPDPKDDLLSKENLQEIIARSQKAELPVMGSNTSKETNYTTNNPARLTLRKKKSSQDLTQPVVTQQSPERSYVPYEYLKRKNPRMLPPPPKTKKQPKPEEGGTENILDFETRRPETEEEEPVVKPKKKVEPKGKPRMVSLSPLRGERKASAQIEKTEKLEEDVTRKEMSEPEAVKKSYPNYLAEIRKQRIEQEKKGGKKYGQWEKILKKKGLSQQEKVNNIMSDINRIEHQAKLKENKLRQHDLQKEYEPLELEDEVGEMYLESIKAKLAIIKDLS